MSFIFIALILGLIPAFIAKSKGRNFLLWYIYGVALFIIALIHACVISKSAEAVKAEQQAQGYTDCPFCKEPVKVGALVCPHCRRDLPQPTPEEVEKQNEGLVKCPTCGFMAPEDEELCPRCHNMLHR